MRESCSGLLQCNNWTFCSPAVTIRWFIYRLNMSNILPWVPSYSLKSVQHIYTHMHLWVLANSVIMSHQSVKDVVSHFWCTCYVQCCTKHHLNMYIVCSFIISSIGRVDMLLIWLCYMVIVRFDRWLCDWHSKFIVWCWWWLTA